MSDNPEPLAAILAEMRDLADHRAADAGGERPGIELLRSYADRIERALRKHDAELVANFAQAFVGSIMKREEGGDHA